MNFELIDWMASIFLKSMIELHSALWDSEPSTTIFVLPLESLNSEYTEGSLNSSHVLSNGQSIFTSDFGPPGSSQPKQTYISIPPEYDISEI
jgi:hypothetical protein